MKKYVFILGLTIALGACKSVGMSPSAKDLSVAQAAPLPNNPVQAFWEADPLLKALLDSALAQSNELKIQWLQRAQSEQVLLQQKSFLRPQASAMFAPSIRKFGQYTMDGVGNFDTQFSPNISVKERIPKRLPDLQLGMQFAWELDVWGKLQDRKKAAALRFLSEGQGYQWSRTLVGTRVIETYGLLCALDQELDIIRFNSELQKSALDLVKVQKEAGVANESGVQQLEAQWLNTQAQAYELQQRIVEAENELRYWLNRPKAQIHRNSKIIEKNWTMVQAGLDLQALGGRPDIQQAKWQLEAQLAQKSAAAKALKPSLMMNGFWGVQGFRPEYLFQLPASAAYNVLLGIALPLVNRRFLLSELKLQGLEAEKAFVHYENSLNRAYLEYQNIARALENLQAQRALKLKEVEANQKAIQAVRQLFQSSDANYLEVLTAQQNALKSQLDLLNLYQGQWANTTRLYRVFGGLQ